MGLKKYTTTAIILLGSFVGGLCSEPAVGFFHRAAASTVAQFLALTGSLDISGAGSAVTSWIYGNLTVTGTPTDNPQAVNNVSISDSAAAPGVLNGLNIHETYGGGASTGNRNALFSFFQMPSMPNAGDASIQNYTAGSFQSFAGTPTKTGLTGGSTYSGYAGSMWGTDNNVSLSTGATNWGSVLGAEYGYAIQTGASAADRFGIRIIPSGVGQGNIDDAALQFSNSTNDTNGIAKTGIQFGGVRQNWPVDPAGTIMKATARSQGGTSSPTALWGIDFSQVAFQSGGGFLKSNGFSVDLNGHLDLSGNINFGAGSGNSPTNSSIYNDIAASGICTDSNQCWLNEATIDDEVDASAAANGLVGWYHLDQVGASAKKGRIGGYYEVGVSTTPSAAGQSYTALEAFTHGNVSLGTATLFGINVVSQGGASFQGAQIVGNETDIRALSGATYNDFIGQQNVIISTHAQPGALTNTGYTVTSQSASTPMFDTLYADGTRTGWPASSTNTTIFKCLPHALTGSCPTIANGIDMTAYAAITGAPILAPLATPSSSSATCKQGAMEWDASFVYICTATNTWKRATLATF